jgi:peptidoglycan-associated lipoprotein
MKKSYRGLLVILIFVQAFVVTGCAKKAEPAKVEEVKPPLAAPAPTPAPAPGSSEGALAVQAQNPMSNIDDGMKALQENNIYFDFDNYDLKPEAQETLNQDAAFLKANPDITIQISGNCDERGTVEYNLALGERRAKAAQDYLVSMGITKERLSVISYGKEKPIDPGHDEEAWAKNRNDQFVIMKK